MLKESMLSKISTEDIRKSVEDKGFSVYEYITIKELLMTVRIDYFDIINAYYTYIVVTCCVLALFLLGPINMEAHTVFYTIVFFSITLYIIIGFIIFRNLFIRSKLFFECSMVVYAGKGVFLGKDFIAYDDKNLGKEVHFYETFFEEKLGHESLLPSLLKNSRRKLLSLYKKGIKSIFSNGKGALFLLMAAVFFMGLSFIFYIFGLIIFFPIFFMYKLFIHIQYEKKNKDIISLKLNAQRIDENLKKCQKIYKSIKKELQLYKAGKINKNFEMQIGVHFKNIYTLLLETVTCGKQIQKVLRKDRYKNAIDLVKFYTYLQKYFQSPIKELIDSIDMKKNEIKKTLSEIKHQISKTQIANHSASLKQKEIHLNMLLKQMNNNIDSLEKILREFNFIKT